MSEVVENNVELNEDSTKKEPEKRKKSLISKILIGIGSSIGSIIALLFVVVLALNIEKVFIYYDYYSIRTVVCQNHGMSDNYVSQGTAITDDGKYLITSGYMSDKTNSRIYVTEINTNTSRYIKLTKNGKITKGHMGGVAIANDSLYLSNDSKVYTLSLKDVLNKETIEMDIGDGTPVNSNASFVFANKDEVYVGEFHHNDKYKTKAEHETTYDGKKYFAIVEVYNPDLTELQRVYAIRDRVQGFAVSDDTGDILISTSYGLSSSTFYYYKKANIIDTGSRLYDKPLYVLDNHILELNGPSMAEDLDYYNGCFYTNFESASNKYIYGKFFLSSDFIVKLNFKTLTNRLEKQK